MVQCSMELQRRTGSSRAWSEAKAHSREARKEETKTKRGVTVGNDKKELQWKRKKREGGGERREGGEMGGAGELRRLPM